VRRRKAFASALDFVSADGVKNRARALGEAMREEKGVANAVVELERIAASDVCAPIDRFRGVH
jgi:hypothetical protein